MQMNSYRGYLNYCKNEPGRMPQRGQIQDEDRGCLLDPLETQQTHVEFREAAEKR
jgi:hypothetical protein